MIIIFIVAKKLSSSTLYGKFSRNTSIKYCGLTRDGNKINIYTSK